MGVAFFLTRLVGVRVSVFGAVVVRVGMLVLDLLLLFRLRRVLAVVPVVRHWIVSFVRWTIRPSLPENMQI
jgi:hypothetical protein